MLTSVKTTIAVVALSTAGIAGAAHANELAAFVKELTAKGYQEVSVEVHDNVVEVMAQNGDMMRHMLLDKNNNTVLWGIQERILNEAQLDKLFEEMTLKNGGDEEESLEQAGEALMASSNVDQALRYMNTKFGPYETITPLLGKYEDMATYPLLAELQEELEEGDCDDD